MKMLKYAILSLLIAAIVSGCTLLSPSGTPKQTLENTDWLLISYRGKDAIIEVKSTVLFQNNEVSGFGGCNQFGGQYTLPTFGGNGIEIGDLASTLMFCVEPEGVMEQEAAFLEILNDADRFEVANDRLMIYNSAKEVLIFKENQ
jgi:heat shock protein HslJ